MVNKSTLRCKNAINKILGYGNLRLQRINDKNKQARLSQQDFIWNKVSILPQVPTIIYIGIGPKGTPALYKYFPNARYFFIDPLEECKKAVDHLLGRGNIYITSAVGSTNATAEINIARKPSFFLFTNVLTAINLWV